MFSQMESLICLLFLVLSFEQAACLVPPRFQWKTIDFAWEQQDREVAIARGDYIPENNMPTGIARWKDKLFITIPRWKKGVPSSLNFVYLNGTQQEPLRPYPCWSEGFYCHTLSCSPSNSTVISTFRVHVDRSDRLWVVDNSISDMTGTDAERVTNPAILIFDLNTDMLIHRFELEDDVLRDSSVLTSIVVETGGKGTFAYITDMGSHAIIVYSLNDRMAWRVESPYFHFDPHAMDFKVGGIEFYSRDGVSGCALSHKKNNGYLDLYFFPTASTKQFKISTKLLRNKDASTEEILKGVQIIGDRGPNSQATSCAFDPQNNVLFYTQVNKNGVSCWNTEKPFNEENTPVVFRDCNVLEYPNDIQVDHKGNIWILSDRQSRFLSEAMDFSQVNFRVLTAPVASFIRSTSCEKHSSIFSLMSRRKSKSSCSCNKIK